MKEIVKSDVITMSCQKIKEKLNDVVEEYDETLAVQNSSSKLLMFLVNDILDFSQLQSGNFSKDISYFDIKEAIHEIYMI